MTDPRAYLADVLAKADAATEGPWLVEDLNYYVIRHAEHGTIAETFNALDKQDATFIASARTTSPAMARALIAVLDECERLRSPAPADPSLGWTTSDHVTLGQNIAIDVIRMAITTELAKEIEQ